MLPDALRAQQLNTIEADVADEFLRVHRTVVGNQIRITMGRWGVRGGLHGGQRYDVLRVMRSVRGDEGPGGARLG